MEHVLEVSHLLVPIPGDNPAGIELRETRTPEYTDIKEARSAARAAERAAMLDPENASDVISNWQRISKLAPTILQEQSKDLEVAVWYLESLIRLHGHQGLCDGITLINGLVGEFWDQLYPLPDEDGIETRVAPLTGINGEGAEGTLIAPIRTLDITAPGTGTGEFDCFSFWNFYQAQEAAAIPDPEKRAVRTTKLGFSIENITQAMANTPDSFLLDLVDALQASLEQYQELDKALYQHCGADAPPSSNIKSILEEVLRGVRFLAKDKLGALEAASAEADAEAKPEQNQAEQAESSSTATTTVSQVAGPVASRETALRQLAEVARFFRATEPHTPIADGLERLIRWGNMPVGELMQELVPDSNARTVYTLLTGVTIGKPGATEQSTTPEIPSSVGQQPIGEPRPQEADDDRNSGW